MKKLLAILVLSGSSTFTFAQGQMLWNNTSSTLISYQGVPMPAYLPPSAPIYFGLFVAPYGTPAPLPGWAGIDDPNWQDVVAYTMNSTAASGAGRMENPGTTTVPGYAPGTTVNFIIRGWQSFTGGADWLAAKSGITNYAATAMGSVVLGGGALPIPIAFGTAAGQVSGFGFVLIPEPSSTTLIGLGLVLLFRFRSQRFNQQQSSAFL